MATRSYIFKIDNNYMKGVYCHYDGYLEHNGEVLLKHYNEHKKVEELISLGDLSVLDINCNLVDGHSFDNRIDGYTVAYHRDRNEEFSQMKVECSDLINAIEHFKSICDDGMIEYCYVFYNDIWYVYFNRRLYALKFDYILQEVEKFRIC